jgi:hypothetical protein
VHLGRKAAIISAPDMPRPFPPKSASTMEVSMVKGVLSLLSPLNVSFDMALLSEGVSANARTGYSGTYVHLGRKAATIWAS